MTRQNQASTGCTGNSLDPFGFLLLPAPNIHFPASLCPLTAAEGRHERLDGQVYDLGLEGAQRTALGTPYAGRAFKYCLSAFKGLKPRFAVFSETALMLASSSECQHNLALCGGVMPSPRSKLPGSRESKWPVVRFKGASRHGA